MLSPLPAMLACTLLLGMVISLWERLPWVLSQRLRFPESVCRDWQSWFSLPVVFLFPLLGHFIDGWDGQYVLFIGVLALAWSLAWLGQVRSVGSSLAALVLLSAAIPCIALPTLAILAQTFSLSDRPLPNADTPLVKPVLVLNVAFMGVMLGLALTPGLVQRIARRFEVRYGFLILALFCLIPALLVALTSAEVFVHREPRALSAVLQDGRCWMLAALTFVYYLLAQLFASSKKNLLAQSGYDLPWVRGVSWLVMLAGLVIVGVAVWSKYEAWALAILALIYAIVMGNMAGEYTNRTGPASLWLAGASFAPLLPTLLAIPINAFRDDPAGTMGIALGAGALANFLLQPSLERFTQRNGVASAMWLSMILALWFCRPGAAAGDHADTDGKFTLSFLGGPGSQAALGLSPFFNFLKCVWQASRACMVESSSWFSTYTSSYNCAGVI